MLRIAAACLPTVAGVRPLSAQLVWEPVTPPPPVPVEVIEPPRSAQAPAAPLRWEMVESPPLRPPHPVAPPPPPPVHTAAEPLPEATATLQWEPVPPEESPLRNAASPDQFEGTALVWEPVPEAEVIEPLAAVADSLERPDPFALPAPVPPPVPKVRGIARGISVNGNPYPDVGIYVPNGFAQDPEATVSATFDWVSRTRSCEVSDGRDWTDCFDAQAYLDITPFKGEDASLGFQWTIQSLTSRNQGTRQFSAQSIGFRTALNLGPTTGIAFGGEHIIQFDRNTDLGRNFYLVLSQAIPLRYGVEEPPLVVATVGIGSDFYGYGAREGNGFLGSTDCLSGNNISSPDYPSGRDCYWGPIGAISILPNSRIAFGAEWSGWGLGAGVSLRPIRDLPLTFSFYATDFLGNTPGYIADICTDNPCQARVYGRVTLSF